MKKQAYIHLAYNQKDRVIKFVKVTKYHDKAHQTQCNNALIHIGHNGFTFISFPFELKQLHTKPFKGLIGLVYSDDLNVREFLKEFIEDRGL